jgi:hypothetical protein
MTVRRCRVPSALFPKLRRSIERLVVEDRLDEAPKRRPVFRLGENRHEELESTLARRQADRPDDDRLHC